MIFSHGAAVDGANARFGLPSFFSGFNNGLVADGLSIVLGQKWNCAFFLTQNASQRMIGLAGSNKSSWHFHLFKTIFRSSRAHAPTTLGVFTWGAWWVILRSLLLLSIPRARINSRSGCCTHRSWLWSYFAATITSLATRHCDTSHWLTSYRCPLSIVNTTYCRICFSLGVGLITGSGIFLACLLTLRLLLHAFFFFFGTMDEYTQDPKITETIV